MIGIEHRTFLTGIERSLCLCLEISRSLSLFSAEKYLNPPPPSLFLSASFRYSVVRKPTEQQNVLKRRQRNARVGSLINPNNFPHPQPWAHRIVSSCWFGQLNCSTPFPCSNYSGRSPTFTVLIRLRSSSLGPARSFLAVWVLSACSPGVWMGSSFLPKTKIMIVNSLNSKLSESGISVCPISVYPSIRRRIYIFILK